MYIDPTTQQMSLTSCHADGTMRFWDTNNGTLLNEVNLQVTNEEGLTSMDFNAENTIAVLAGSKGHVRVSFSGCCLP